MRGVKDALIRAVLYDTDKLLARPEETIRKGWSPAGMGVGKVPTETALAMMEKFDGKSLSIMITYN
jgi:hypothetical protein